MSAHLLPDSISESDLHAFHRLAVLAASSQTPNGLLTALRDHLAVPAAVICPPQSTPPQTDRVIVVQLYRHNHYLGDLCVDQPPNADGTILAARLSFFAPIVALTLAVEPSQTQTGPESQPWQVAPQEERDRLEAILEATNDAILMIDTDSVPIMTTLQFETLISVPRYEFLGKPVEYLAQRIEVQPGLPVRLASLLRSLAGNSVESLGGELEIKEPQLRILVWYSVPIYAQTGMLMGRLFAFRDVTRERELDRMKTEFITLVSHELRTPLTSVKGFSDLILENKADSFDSETREYLQIVALNADRLIALINDILDVTRIETDRVKLKPNLCPMQEVIWQVVTSMRPMIEERHHRLVVDIEPYLPPAWADRDRMSQVVTNLLSNAAKYTLEPGQITVQARYVQAKDALPSGAPRDHILPCILVMVQDTGIGIPLQDQPNLFKPFYRIDNEASRAVGGTGLGLTIVKSFVEMQGGRVWLESTPGRGSIFWFTVPVVEGKSPVAGDGS